MTFALGIDTGGTYTDAALVDHTSGRVLVTAKALTTYHDLSIGIGQAVQRALLHSPEPGGSPVSPSDIKLVALSSTLATNAIVEGRGCPVCLILIGYDPDLIREYGFERDLVTRDVVYLRGGHDGAGNEAAPLDEAAARAAIVARRGRVEAFAVSGYFGVRNPAHESRVRDLVHELAALPVTCGHELSTQLNAVRRATTAALNARLIPLLQELITTVRSTLNAQGIAAPLMVVKGDGSLVRAEWAMRRPVETILSGPAASVVGAWHLAGRRDVWTVDVGGTTTDIAALNGGRPRLNPAGAQVGPWRTMVRAVDVHTVGLGGDSQVSVDEQGQPHIGPRRVMPLCLLASQYPYLVRELQLQLGARKPDTLAGQFALGLRPPSPAVADEDADLLRELLGAPQSLSALADRSRYGLWVTHQIERLEAQRLVLRAGFTPTDALHVLGRFQEWDVAAARLGAELWARQAGLAPEKMCERVVAGVSDLVTTALVSKILSDETAAPNWEAERTASALLARALGRANHTDLGCNLKLNKPIIAIGAPAPAYLPRSAEQLGTELAIPAHADVANAVGAVAGSVVQQLYASIRPLDGDKAFRLHLPEAVLDFDTVDESVAYADQVIPPQLRALAREAGADQIETRMTREDQTVTARGGWNEVVYLGTELTYTAVGRPSLAQE
jgi:N-methylhydantoinase A/oxoprolinase/acetone carboxylase beta subunit